MTINYTKPGELIDVSELGDDLASRKTHTLAKSENAEIKRLVLPAGKEIPTHSAPGQIIVQCLEGRIAFTAMGREQVIEPAQLLYLPPREPHSVKAIDDSSVLVTIILPRRAS